MKDVIKERERLELPVHARQVVFGGADDQPYVWKVGAIATIPPDQAVTLVAPTVQRYLNGRLPGLNH